MINPNGYYTFRKVRELTTLSVPTIWRMRKSGKFPEPVPLSDGRKGWPIAVIHHWLAERAQRNLDEQRETGEG